MPISEGFLANPAPNPGQNAVMGNITPSSAPAAGALGMMNPSVQNNVKETMVNAYATYPFVARKWTNGFEKDFV